MNLFVRLVSVTLLATLSTLCVHTPAHAVTPHQLVEGLNWAATNRADSWIENPSDDAFYQPPAQFDPTPGAIIKTQPAPHLLNVLGPGFRAYAQKIMYTSRDQDNNPVPVTGYVIEPANPWLGKGEVPTLVFAPGTRGQGNICAPSRGPWLTSAVDTADHAIGFNYELPLQYLAAASGMRVVVTDYIGLGTPGVHTYVNNIEQAHAVLDAARAALRVNNLPYNSPVGFYGYSQGGGAVAAAAEHAQSYAPELNVKGTFAGAPPADLEKVFFTVDGTILSGVLGMAINGFAARNMDFKNAIEKYLTDEGKIFLSRAATSCVPDLALRDGFKATSEFSTTSRRMGEILLHEPAIAQTLAQQRIGTMPLNAPMMVGTATADDIVPNDQVQQMAQDFCAQGGQVLMRQWDIKPIQVIPGSALTHSMPLFLAAPESLKYMFDRFNDEPAPSNCA
ncbi:MAG: lipase family protein [Corynebacterium sp.]|uniref:lipase family protein n=1 Tax=Corynebacterium sp. TaxID=1720 RepID=UPI0026DB82C4|nr:lipase family protein [Corynebacterium sp.]MDO4762377.1 lipase family protein [Corynebacterium sp.]